MCAAVVEGGGVGHHWVFVGGGREGKGEWGLRDGGWGKGD